MSYSGGGGGGSGGSGGSGGAGAGAGGAAAGGAGSSYSKSSLDTVKAGAIRFNTDNNQMEIYDGNQWTGIVGDSPEQHTGGTRGLWAGGEPLTSTVSFATLETTGDTALFGDLQGGLANMGAASNRSRAIFAGGEPETSTMTSFTIASQGNFTHNGEDLTSGRRFVTGMAGGNRGIFMGGSEPTRVNKIDYISISNFASAIDFGDLVEAKDMGGGGAWSNGIIGGGMGGFKSDGNNSTIIESITISTLGNAVQFGDLFESKHNIASASNSVRAIGAGGSPSTVDTIQYITMSSFGNALDFGNLTTGTTSMNACTSPTRIVWGGGNVAPAKTNKMEYVQIMTKGDAVDFGDLSQGAVQNPGACSNGHGGLH